MGKLELLVVQSSNPDGKAKGYESDDKPSTSGASLPLCQTEIGNFLSMVGLAIFLLLVEYEISNPCWRSIYFCAEYCLILRLALVCSPMLVHMFRMPVSVSASGNVECNQEKTEALNYKYIGMRGCSYLTEMVKILGDDSGVEEISSNVSDQVTVQGGYEVKKEYVPTVSAILEKQGNIAKNCFLHTVEVRSFFLEQIAIIVEKLDKKFVQIKEFEVTKLLGDVKDIDSVNIEIEWLHDRLKKIQEVKKLLSMKTEKDRNDETMKEVKQVLQQLHQRSTLLTERRKAAEARSEKIKETVKNSEADLNFFMKYSLRHGLL